LDQSNGDSLLGRGFVIFQEGYDCLFSFSLTDPSACGLSWSQGQHRAAVGAITDLSGQLITPQNPVHQGQPMTLWTTGLSGLVRDEAGLLETTNSFVVGFGVAQDGKDIPATVSSGLGYAGPVGQFQALSTWAGESPQL